MGGVELKDRAQGELEVPVGGRDLGPAGRQRHCRQGGLAGPDVLEAGRRRGLEVGHLGGQGVDLVPQLLDFLVPRVGRRGRLLHRRGLHGVVLRRRHARGQQQSPRDAGEQRRARPSFVHWHPL